MQRYCKYDKRGANLVLAYALGKLIAEEDNSAYLIT
jgi:hypothetical protein